MKLKISILPIEFELEEKHFSKKTIFEKYCDEWFSKTAFLRTIHLLLALDASSSCDCSSSMFSGDAAALK